jgi:hypothetical protein
MDIHFLHGIVRLIRLSFGLYTQQNSKKPVEEASYSHFPGTYSVPNIIMLPFQGLKKSLIVVTLGESIGAIIKIFSVSRDRFYILMIGQGLMSICYSFTFALVGRFTACWFGSKEISRAGALTLLGDQVRESQRILVS